MTRLDDTLRFHETALRIRSQRQEHIASNIANADTPNYKPKDIDFAQAMQAALGGSGSGGLAKTSAAHLSSAGHKTAGSVQASSAQVSRDGNAVNLDQERGAFIDNALRYEAGVSMVNGRLKSLMSVIQG